jgi:galactokinase
VNAAGLFLSAFAAAPDGVWFAPGRANLMGEHTDYNEGFVLPFALAQGTHAAMSPRADGLLAVCSAQVPEGGVVTVPVADLKPGVVTGWAAYPAGVAWALREAGYDVAGGASIAIDSDVPEGAGLSSSAALECAVALALAGVNANKPDLATIARRAENEFAGVPTGIMDQSASLLCQAGHALLLDCQSLAASQVPFTARLLVINTRARHELSDGEYGNRRTECEEAARLLGVSSLRGLTTCADTARLSSDVLRRRARHVCTDNERVLAVVSLLRGSAADPLPEIGQLLTQAHASLRDDFEISWPEADVAVEAAVKAGAYGARMIGGGFGGSVLALLPSDAVASAVSAAIETSFAAHGFAAPAFLDAVPSDGARRLT